MNDLGREVLVAAWLRAHPQTIGLWHGDEFGAGDCAQGVFHLDLHQSRRAALACYMSSFAGSCKRRIMAKYDISLKEWDQLADLNDDGADFLTISRKVGVPEEGPAR